MSDVTTTPPASTSGFPFCPVREVVVEDTIDKILTQYRESPLLLWMIRVYLNHVVDVMLSICDMMSHFRLDTAIGDQLTLLGQRLGWPRCHCVCVTQPLFGFECDEYPSLFVLTGFCAPNQTWYDCGPFSTSDICLNDDETYRKFLMVRRYQMLTLYSHDDLTAAIQIFWGPTASIL